MHVARQPLHLRHAQMRLGEHLGSAVDRGERVAEIVHDRGSKPADGGDPLLVDQVLARAPDGSAHLVEAGGQPAELVLAADVEADLVVLPRHFGGGAVEFLHRLDELAGERVSQGQAGRHGKHPEQNNVAPQARDLPLRGIERAQDGELAGTRRRRFRKAA